MNSNVYGNKGAVSQNQNVDSISKPGASVRNDSGYSQLYQVGYKGEAIVLMETSKSPNFENNKVKMDFSYLIKYEN